MAGPPGTSISVLSCPNNKVVMLVISMLDRDPHVEREPRNLAAHSYESEMVYS